VIVPLILGWFGAALAHGGGFEVGAVSMLPADPSQIWVVVDGQGVAWTNDGGSTWTWSCEGALSASRLYDVLALDDGIAVVATLEGPVQVDAIGGTSAKWEGFPEGAFSDHLARTDNGFLVGAVGEGTGGFWSCDATGCVATQPNDSSIFPKSIRRGSDGWYATVVTEESLAGSLWWSPDAETWVLRYSWQDGDVDPRVVLANRDGLLVWLIPRDEAGLGRLVRSTDGGISFTTVLTAAEYSSRSASVADTAKALVWGDGVAETRLSTDGGATWTDATADLPEILCADSVEGTGLLCADHLYDGIDLATSSDGWTWTPIACLEDAMLASWAADSCVEDQAAWTTAAALGGGRCGEVINPPKASEDTTPACSGCPDANDSAALLAFPLLSLVRRRPTRDRR
jgi:hypothetical protein